MDDPSAMTTEDKTGIHRTASEKFGVMRIIQRELDAFEKEPQPFCYAGLKPPKEEGSAPDAFHWEAVIQGPPSTPYEGGVFFLDIQLRADYPLVPPKVRFSTPIYHCNVHPSGAICMDNLEGNWSPVWTLQSILTGIVSLMFDPEAEEASSLGQLCDQ